MSYDRYSRAIRTPDPVLRGQASLTPCFHGFPAFSQPYFNSRILLSLDYRERDATLGLSFSFWG